MPGILLFAACATTEADRQLDAKVKAIKARQAEEERTGVRWHPKPPRPSVLQIAQTCKQEALSDRDNGRIPATAQVTCLYVAPAVEDDVVRAALYDAARTAVLLQRETLSVTRLRTPPPSYVGIAVSWSEQADGLPASAGPVARYRASDILDAETYAALQEAQQIGKEDDLHRQCRALVLDLDAAAKEPGRAQACGTTVAMIEREREQRRKQEAEDEDLRKRREALAQERVRRQQALAPAAASLPESERRHRGEEAVLAAGDPAKQLPSYEAAPAR